MLISLKKSGHSCVPDNPTPSPCVCELSHQLISLNKYPGCASRCGGDVISYLRLPFSQSTHVRLTVSCKDLSEEPRLHNSTCQWPQAATSLLSPGNLLLDFTVVSHEFDRIDCLCFPAGKQGLVLGPYWTCGPNVVSSQEIVI